MHSEIKFYQKDKTSTSVDSRTEIANNCNDIFITIFVAMKCNSGNQFKSITTLNEEHKYTIV